MFPSRMILGLFPTPVMLAHSMIKCRLTRHPPGLTDHFFEHSRGHKTTPKSSLLFGGRIASWADSVGNNNALRFVWLMHRQSKWSQRKDEWTREKTSRSSAFESSKPSGLGEIGRNAPESHPSAARQARREPVENSEGQTDGCVLHLTERRV